MCWSVSAPMHTQQEGATRRTSEKSNDREGRYHMASAVEGVLTQGMPSSDAVGAPFLSQATTNLSASRSWLHEAFRCLSSVRSTKVLLPRGYRAFLVVDGRGYNVSRVVRAKWARTEMRAEMAQLTLDSQLALSGLMADDGCDMRLCMVRLRKLSNEVEPGSEALRSSLM